LQKEKKGDRF